MITQGFLSIRRRLNAVELRILPALGDKRVVRSGFHDPGSVQHDDEIRHPYRRKAVGYEDGNAADAIVTTHRRRVLRNAGFFVARSTTGFDRVATYRRGFGDIKSC